MTNINLNLSKLDTSHGDLLERSMSSEQSDHPMFSYSQAGTWNACEEKWNNSYRKGYTLPLLSQAADTGTKVHEGMDVLYGNQRSTVALKAWMDSQLEEFGNGSAEELDVLYRAFFILNQYTKLYMPNNDVGIKIIDTELHIAAPFKTPKGRSYWLQGYVDALMDGEIWDHKTMGYSGFKGFWSEYQARMDPQLTIYAAILKKNYGISVNRTVYNQMNVYRYKDWKNVELSKLFARLVIVRTDQQIRNTIIEFGMLVDELLDRYTNTRMSLGKHCGYCLFNEACMMKLKGFDPNQTLRTNYIKKNPDPTSEVIKEEGLPES